MRSEKGTAEQYRADTGALSHYIDECNEVASSSRGEEPGRSGLTGEWCAGMVPMSGDAASRAVLATANARQGTMLKDWGGTSAVARVAANASSAGRHLRSPGVTVASMRRSTLPLAGSLLVATLALASTARAGEPKIDYQSFELRNGLRVYVIEDHKVPMVYEVLWVEVGSKDEIAQRTGFAHLFEHLMFKGSTHLPDGLMDRLLEAGGGWSTAFTTRDMTVYQNAAGSNFFETMLWIEADRLAGLTDTLDQPKLDNQRDVVLNERRQGSENRPYGMAAMLLGKNLWPRDHGYHWNTIGYPADLHAATLPDVSGFFKKYYVPNNARLVIAGDVKFEDARRLVEKYFAWIPRAAEPARPSYRTPAPLTRQVVVNTTDDVKVPRVYLAWRGPTAFSAGEPALEMAAAVLGGGKTSRLYRRLVYQEQIAQDVQAWFAGYAIGGKFEIVATAKPGVDPRRLVDEITEEIAKLAATGPDPDELQRAQSTYESDFLHDLESPLQRAIRLAWYDVFARDAAYFAKDLARFRAVSVVQVQSAIAIHLKTTARVVLTISPGKRPPEEDAP
jgi:zinc protease